MEGETRSLYQWMHINYQLTSCSAFLIFMELQFDPLDFKDH